MSWRGDGAYYRTSPSRGQRQTGLQISNRMAGSPARACQCGGADVAPVSLTKTQVHPPTPSIICGHMTQLFRRKPITDLVNEAHGLKRELGAGDLIMLAIGAVI